MRHDEIPALCDRHDDKFWDFVEDDVVTPDQAPTLAQFYARTCPDCQEAT